LPLTAQRFRLSRGERRHFQLRLTTVTNPPAQTSPGIGRRIFLSLFFAFFLAMGLGFTAVVGRSFLANAKTYTWTTAECTILESNVVPAAGKDGVELQLRYRYRFAAQEYSSTRLSQGITSSRDTAEIYRLAERLRSGTTTSCYVNPASPEEAMLFREGLWSGLIVLFPLVFVAVGLGGIFFIWRGPKTSAAISAKPLSSGPAGNRGARLGLGIFFGLFFLIGVGGGYGLLWRPVSRIVAAQTWDVVPCTIISSRVVSHSGDSTTYSVEVVYRYTINGRSFTSARYKFMSGSSSGYSGKAAIAAQFAPGKNTTGYVNPRDPTDAVLERRFTTDLLFGLIPLVFGIIGAAGLWFGVLRSRKTSNAFVGPGSFSTAPISNTPPASGELPVTQSRTVKLIGMFAFAVIWNGIVSIFVVTTVSEWRRGQHPWFLTLFITPFVGIGLFAFGGAIRQALALSNPRPRLTAHPPAAAPGGEVQITWTMEGKTELLRDLIITFEGREEATYRRGTDTATDKNVFARLELLNTTDPSAIRAGTVRVTLPSHTMHSWASPNNRVIWSLHVRGKIPRWPDIDDEFAFTVLPLPLPAA
jgi:hypothetical protein